MMTPTHEPRRVEHIATGWRVAAWSAVAAMCLAAACAAPTRGLPSPDAADAAGQDVGGDVDGQPPSFAADAHPILMASCAGACHGAAISAFLLSGDATSDYEPTLDWVDLDEPEQSSLLRKASAATFHGGGAILTPSDDDYATLLAWITHGALP